MVAWPTTPGPQPTPAHTRNRFSSERYSKDFCEVRVQAFGDQASGAIEQLGEGRSFESKHAEVGQQLLLADPEPQRVDRQLWLCGTRRRFLDRELARAWMKRDNRYHLLASDVVKNGGPPCQSVICEETAFSANNFGHCVTQPPLEPPPGRAA